MKYLRMLFDNFTLTLLGVVLIATLLPCSGQGAVVFGWLTNLAIGLLFFLHGAKLSREAIIKGAGHWRLHLLVFSCTFVLFPLLGLAFKPLFVPLVGNELYPVSYTHLDVYKRQTLWSTLLSRHPAGKVAPFSLLVPVIGLSSSAWLLGERLSAIQGWGALLVMVGLLINVFGSRLSQRLRAALC